MHATRRLHHLQQTTSGWRFRFVVPAELRPVLGVREIRRTLCTSDLLTARRRSLPYRHLAETLTDVARAMRMGRLTRAELDSIQRGELNEWLDWVDDIVHSWDPRKDRLEDHRLGLLEVRERTMEALEAHNFRGSLPAADTALRSRFPGREFSSEDLSRAAEALLLGREMGARYSARRLDRKPAAADIDVFLRSALAAEPSPAEQGPLLSELIPEYITHKLTEGSGAKHGGKGWSPKTAKEHAPKLRELVELVGDIPVGAVTFDLLIKRYRNILPRIPINRVKRFKDKPIDALLDEELDIADRLSGRTCDERIGTIKTFFRWARTQHSTIMQANPAAELEGFPKNTPMGTPFSDDQLAIIFAPSSFGQGPTYAYWGPLIALFTGARVGEIAQLRAKHVCQIEGRWCFDLGDPELQIKTAASQRRIPIHKSLEELGILEHANTLADGDKDALLLRDINVDQARPGKYLSRWFSEYRQHRFPKVEPRSMTFHDFRDTMLRRAERASKDYPAIDALLGHSAKGEKRNYRPANLEYEIGEVAAVVDAVEFPSIDIKALRKLGDKHRCS